MKRICLEERGADGSGRLLCTGIIQEAIDQLAREGGGVLEFPPGTFRSGTVRLASQVEVRLAAGTVWQGSDDLADYPEQAWGHNKDRQPHHFIVAKDCENVTLRGGVIDGAGPAFWHPEPSPSGWFRERERRPSPMVELVNCRHVRLEGVTIRNSPGWTCHLHGCRDVQMRGVRILNNFFGPNTDGIDINGCQDVLISDCQIDTGDDAIVVKTTPDARPCERIVVTNCLVRSNCVGLKLGAMESYQDMRDIIFSNCVVHGSHRMFGLYSYNGATLENIMVNGITGDTLVNSPFPRPIHLDVHRKEADRPLGKIRGVVIQGFAARTRGRILITGEEPGHVEDVVLRDVRLDYREGVQDPVPLLPPPGGGSVQFSNGNLTARGVRAALIAEHVHRLRLENVRLSWAGVKTDFPFGAVWARGVTWNGIDVDSDGPCPGGGEPFVLEACRPWRVLPTPC